MKPTYEQLLAQLRKNQLLIDALKATLHEARGTVDGRSVVYDGKRLGTQLRDLSKANTDLLYT
jgi:hypothetical protein